MPSAARVGAANGRVYDPLTAQFFSPDPYVQAPDNWLNYNRYAYAYGNPFKYTDPSGENPVIIYIIIIAADGFINVVQNWDDIKAAYKENGWEGVGKGLGYFGAGAASGALTVFGGSLGAFGGNYVKDISNSLLRNGNLSRFDFERTTMTGIFSMAFSASGGLIGDKLSPLLKDMGLNKFWMDATKNFIANSFGSIGGDFTYFLYKTQNISEAWNRAWTNYSKNYGWLSAAGSAIGQSYLSNYDLGTKYMEERKSDFKNKDFLKNLKNDVFLQPHQKFTLWQQYIWHNNVIVPFKLNFIRPSYTASIYIPANSNRKIRIPSNKN